MSFERLSRWRKKNLEQKNKNKKKYEVKLQTSCWCEKHFASLVVKLDSILRIRKQTIIRTLADD